MIKVVFFDVGGTLLMPFPSVGAIYSSVAERYGVNVKPETLNLRFKEMWKTQKAEKRVVDKRWWKDVVNSVFHDEKFNQPEKFFEDLYATFERKDVWHVFEDVVPTLKLLKERGIHLAVASNWDSRLPALLKILGLNGYFEKQFISFDVGFVKPDPQFFQHALTSMNVDALEAIHIGDDPLEDVQGAQSVGIRAYLIDRKRKPRNSRELVSLDEVIDRI